MKFIMVISFTTVEAKRKRSISPPALGNSVEPVIGASRACRQPASRIAALVIEASPPSDRHFDEGCDLEGRVLRGRALAESVLERRTRGARPSKRSRNSHYGIPWPLQRVEAPPGHPPAKPAEPAKGGGGDGFPLGELGACVSNPCCDPTTTFAWNGRLEPAANRGLTT